MSFNYHVILKMAGTIVTIIGLTMIPSLIVAVYYGENKVVIAFLMTIIPALLLGIYILLKVRPQSTSLKFIDG